MTREQEIAFAANLRELSVAIIEQCAAVALEQRCERGTPWDLACVTIAAKIRELAEPSPCPQEGETP